MTDGPERQEPWVEPALLGGGFALLAAGLLLCFAGVRTLRLAAFAAGLASGPSSRARWGAGAIACLASDGASPTTGGPGPPDK